MIVRVRGLLKNKRAFTLVEVLASIVIISIVLIGAMNLIIFTNKTAVQNNDKLVAINLAKGTIERMKIYPFAYIDMPSDSPDYTKRDSSNPFIYDKTNCKENCNRYSALVNDKTYEIQLAVSQTQEERNMNLINVVVTVELPDKVSNKVEGYISYEPK